MIRRRFLLALLLQAVVLAAYAPGLDNDLVGDDLEWVRFALSVRETPRLVFSLFSGFVTPAANAAVGVNAALGGTATWPYNLTGLLLHMINVALLHRLLAAVTRSRAAAWWAAAWWGVNYGHDEAVLWLGGRPHVMVVTGILTALLLQRRWLREGGAGSAAAALAAGTFAILSKESGVMVAPMAAVWVLLFVGRARPPARAWAVAAGLASETAIHAGVLWAVRAEHQFYYRLDWSFLGRMAGSLLGAAGLPIHDPPPAWLLAPAGLLALAVAVRGGSVARFGVLTMILGTLPTVLIEHQPPRYRYLPLVGAAFVLAALIAAVLPALRRSARIAAGGVMALLCLHLAAGVRNDEAFLDEAGRIHRSLRDAFCAALPRSDRTAPLVVVWAPSLRGVEAMREAANREVAWEVRNFPPIFVRAGGLEGLAEPETLHALCGGEESWRAQRLTGADAARAVATGPFRLIAYANGRFTTALEGPEEVREAIARAAAAGSGLLPDGRRWAVLGGR